MHVRSVASIGVEKALQEAVAVLRGGGVVAHATETCYGLACDLTNRSAVERLFAVKERPAAQPVSALFPTTAAAAAYLTFIPEHRALAEERLPGPVTLILPVSPQAPHVFFVAAEGMPAVTAGVRVSSHPLAAMLAQAYGLPISTTSANRHGLPPCYSIAALLEQWEGCADRLPDLCLDEGVLPERPPSVIIDCTDGGKVLR